MSFFFLFISPVQWNWRKAQNRFLLESSVDGEEGGGKGRRKK
jgi:hypothetical protein